MDVFGDRDEEWEEPIHWLKSSPPSHSIHSIHGHGFLLKTASSLFSMIE
jgi:hypothetical protein